jgi:hypothetical protein
MTFRLLDEREPADDDARFTEIFRALKLVRITLEKHEIAKDRRSSEPLQLVRSPARDDGGPAAFTLATECRAASLHR